MNGWGPIDGSDAASTTWDLLRLSLTAILVGLRLGPDRKSQAPSTIFATAANLLLSIGICRRIFREPTHEDFQSALTTYCANQTVVSSYFRVAPRQSEITNYEQEE